MGTGGSTSHQSYSVAPGPLPVMMPGQDIGTVVEPNESVDGRRLTLIPVASTAVRAIGWDPDGGRLEVQYHSGDRIYAYHNVPRETWNQMRSGDVSIGQTVHQIASDPQYRYDSDAAAALAGQYRRCPHCGRFANDAHVCPPRVSGDARNIDHTDFAVLVVAPADQLRRALDEHPDGITTGITCQVIPSEDDVITTVSGDGLLYRTADGRVAVNVDDLTCNCGGVDCDHRQRAAAEWEQTLNPGTTLSPRQQQRLADDLAAEHASSQQMQAAARSGWPDPDPSYTDHPELFQAAYEAGRDRAQRGESAVPYMLEDATGGLGARDGGRGFGVELEFDLARGVSGEERAETLRSIARAMHEAGLSSDRYVHGYHEGRRLGGYSDAANDWRMELDGSVAGEVVSPILYDEPTTWRNLDTVCQIIRDHGGIATLRTGSHVTVSTHDYDHTVENHNRLLNTFASYEDTLYRLGTDPSRNQHRYSAGSSYCEPNDVPCTGYFSIGSVRRNHGSHSVGLNLAHSYGRSNDRVECRS